MPTYAFTRTREQMRDMILRKLGEKSDGQAPDAETAEIVYEAMALRLRELHGLGIKWYQVAPSQTTVALVAGTATASLSAVTDFLFPVTAMLTVGTEQREMRIVGHRTYQAIPNKAESGEPELMFTAGGTAYFWPVPNANGSAKITYEAIAADLVTATAPDLPVEMMRAFAILCAADLVPDFNVKPQQAATIYAQVDGAMKTIRALSAERVDTETVSPDWF